MYPTKALSRTREMKIFSETKPGLRKSTFPQDSMKKASQVRPLKGRGFQKKGGGGDGEQPGEGKWEIWQDQDQGRLPRGTRPLVTASSLLDSRSLYSSCYALHLKEDTRAVKTAVQAWAPRTHVKSQRWYCVLLIPPVGKRNPGVPWSTLGSLSGFVREFQI